jgi:two-component system response regulator CiaR
VGSRILIVEDDEDLCEELREVLKGEGLKVEFAYSGDHGLKLARGGEYDLMVLDLMLPGRSGLEILKELGGRDPAPPVLVLTGHPLSARSAESSSQDLKREIASLADGVTTKPFKVPQLLDWIRALLR